MDARTNKYIMFIHIYVYTYTIMCVCYTYRGFLAGAMLVSGWVYIRTVDVCT